MKQAKVFIIYHPAGLTLFKPIVDLIRENYPDIDCFLIKVFHPYWKGFEAEGFLSGYNLTFSLPDVEYKTNIISGWPQAWLFQKKTREICKTLITRYEKINVYTMNSAYLPVNILLNQFYRSSVANIYRFGRGSHADLTNEPRDRLHSIITSSYCYIFGLFKVLTIKLPGITSYIYSHGNPTREVMLENPYASTGSEKLKHAESVLPEPFLLLKRRQNAGRNLVVIFGDSTILKTYSQYINDVGNYDKNVQDFFTRLKSFYKGHTLLYKPHLSDYGRVESVIEQLGFTIYNEQKDAEMLLIDNLERVKAVYSFSSTASVLASLMRIPAYHFYKIFFNAEGVKALDELAEKGGWYGNPYFRRLLTTDEIGSIDSIPIETDMEHSWRERWVEFLK